MAQSAAVNFVRGATEAQRYYLGRILDPAFEYQDERRRHRETWECVRCGAPMGDNPALFCRECLWR